MKKHIAGLLALLFIFSAVPFASVQADEPADGENLVYNPGFETIADDGFADGWACFTLDGKPYAEVDQTKKHSGDSSAKISTQTGGNPWVRTEIKGLTPGATYEVSAWTNSDIEAPGMGAGLLFKLEFYSAEEISATTGCGEHFSDKWPDSTNNLWIQRKSYFTVPEGTILAVLYCRMMYANGTAWFDDVEVKYAGDPEKYAFEIGDVFHYPHEKVGSATVSLASFFVGKPVETEGRVDFELRDGDKVLCTQMNTPFTDLQAVFTYDIGLLTEKQKPYTVYATARWGGEEVTYTQNVYVFDRPTMLGDDGIIRINGEPFNPIMAYHVKDFTWDKVAESSINVVQFGIGGHSEEHFKECDRILDILDENGMKALFVLYKNMKPAAHPDNIEFTKAVVEYYKDDPRIFAWAVMDEPFSQSDSPEMREWMEKSYTTIRSIDSMHPINITDMSFLSPKYSDIFTNDAYAKEDNRSVSLRLHEVNEHHKGEIHHQYLADTYKQNGVMQTEKGFRGSVYRAFEGGTKGIGYYSILDAIGHDTGDVVTPLYELDLWEPFCKFNKNEVPVLFDIFVNNTYEKLNEYRGEDIAEGDYWSTWTDGKVVYMIVHNKSIEKKTITVPLKSANGLVSFRAKQIELVGGPAEIPSGTDSLSVELADQSVALFKITPDITIDTSLLKQSPFTDIDGYDWAKADIEALYADAIINSVGENLFGPGQNITRADFAMFLIRTLGLTSVATENFADVDPNAYYAKELAIGRALGILKGVDGINYNPLSEISRQDLMTICFRGMQIAKKKMEDNAAALDAFGDKDMIADYAQDAVRMMAGTGIIKGDDNGNVNPFGNTTRAEAAVIMNRIKMTESDVLLPQPTESPNTEPEQEPIPDTTVTATAPTEAQLKAWTESIAFLKNLGILEEELQPTGKVSRGESAKLFVKTQGVTADLKTGETPFSDVPAESEFAGYIESMFKQGFMSGVTADRFVPENSLTYNQTIKILVSILGYAPHAESSGAYPAGYLSVASRIDLLDGTTPDGEAPVQPGALAKLIHNALGIDLVRPASYGEDASGELKALENCTLLSEYFNIQKYKGKLTGNYYTKLENGPKLSETQVAMGDILFEIGNTHAADFVGQEVILYARNTEEKEIVDITAKKSVAIIEIYGESVSPKTNEATLEYEDEAEETRKIEIGGATLVYNGKVKTGWTKDDLQNINGTISLICNNGNAADVIFVWYFNNYVVDKVIAKENKVYFKDGSFKILDTEDKTVKTLLVDASGASIGLDALAEWSIVSVAENTNFIKAVHSNKKVEGEVTEKGTDTVRLNDTIHKISAFSSVTPVLGKTEIFYLDFMDKIVIKDDSVGDITYGYFITISKDKGLDGNVQLKIFTTDNEMKVFETTDMVNYNDEGRVDSEVLLTAPELTLGSNSISQLVIYETNDSGQITALKTAKNCIGASEADRLSAFSLDVKTTDSVEGGPFALRGYPGGGRLLGSLYRVEEKTILFKVPEVASDNPKDYAVYDHTALTHSTNYFFTDFYDVDEDYVVSVLVQKAPAYEKGGSGLAVVKDIRQALNADGVPQKAIAVITNTGVEDMLYVEDDFAVYFGAEVITDVALESEVDIVGGQRTLKKTISPDKLKPGDVISYSKLDNGTVNGVGVLFRAETPISTELATGRTTTEFDNYYPNTRAFGTVEKVVKDGVIMTPNYKRAYIFTQSAGNFVKVLLYNRAKNKFEEIAPQEVKVDDRVFVYKSNTNVEMVIVYR
ncbi:MAG: hypothetical protein E7408_06860 [Ruminococcaceae bacterium]|nr:hypothetical protein [Oscillospiraceae bacterium]